MPTFFKYALCWAGLLLPLLGYGQDVPVPLGVLPMQYNPSFAGEAGGPRISTNVRLRTGRGFYGKGYGLHSSYDQFVPALRSGIGITVGYQQETSAYSLHSSPLNNIREYEYYSRNGYHASFAVAPKFSVKGKYTLSPSLDVAYNSENFSADQSLPRYYSDYYSIRSRAGLLFNTDRFYIGYSVYLVDHYNQDTTRFNPDGREKGFTSHLQLGYTFERSATANFSFTPQLVFFIGADSPLYQQSENPRHLLNYFGPVALNLNFRYKKFIWGLNNAGIHVGYQSDRTRIMLSNIVGQARRDMPGYTANLSFRYVFRDDNR